MPYKDPVKQREAMRIIMQNRRRQQRLELVLLRKDKKIIDIIEEIKKGLQACTTSTEIYAVLHKAVDESKDRLNQQMKKYKKLLNMSPSAERDLAFQSLDTKGLEREIENGNFLLELCQVLGNVIKIVEKEGA